MIELCQFSINQFQKQNHDFNPTCVSETLPTGNIKQCSEYTSFHKSPRSQVLHIAMLYCFQPVNKYVIQSK